MRAQDYLMKQGIAKEAGGGRTQDELFASTLNGATTNASQEIVDSNMLSMSKCRIFITSPLSEESRR